MFIYVFRNPLFQGLNQSRKIVSSFPLPQVVIDLMRADGWTLEQSL